MTWFLNNWSFLVVIACAACVGVFYCNKFVKLPSEKQIAMVKSWLLYAVIEAESIYQSGTGTLKLHYVYDLFIAKFPAVASVVAFETFAKWVDEVLIEMRHILETNKDIEAYVTDTPNYK